MRKITERIPHNKMRDFHLILVANGGGYIGNPLKMQESWLTTYYLSEQLQDQKNFYSQWNRIKTPIFEVRKDQWWRVLGRRIKGIFK